MAFPHSDSTPAPRTLPDVIGGHAAGAADRVALRFVSEREGAAEVLTYGALWQRAQAIASSLAEADAPGARVLLLFPPGLEFVTALTGCLCAGMVPVPADPPNLTHVHRSIPDLQAIAVDADPALAVTTPKLLSLAELAFDLAPELKKIHWLSTASLRTEPTEGWKAPSIDAQATALVQYTAGASGAPKGVRLTHAALLAHLEEIRQRFVLDPGSRGVIGLPLHHDFGLWLGVLETLYLGAETTVLSPNVFTQRPLSWLEILSWTHARWSGGPNAAYERCARTLTTEERADLDLTGWEIAFVGGEPIRAETLDAFVEAFEPCGFRRGAFVSCYQLAEAGLLATSGSPLVHAVQSTALERDQVIDATSGRRDALRLASSGTAIEGKGIRIVDDAGAPCPPGRVGEIWIAQGGARLSYWGRDEESERTFGATLTSGSDDRYLRTGDLGFLVEDQLFVLGPKSDRIRLRGRQPHPALVEAALERAHPALRHGAGAAFSVEIGDDKRLVAAIEIERRYLTDREHGLGTRDVGASDRRAGDATAAPAPPPLDAAAVGEAVRDAVRNRLALEVRDVVLLKPGAIPRTASGKIRRAACQTGFRAGTLSSLTQRAGPDRRWLAEFVELVTIAFRNVVRNRRRSLITGAMVAVGLTAIVFSKAYIAGINALITEMVVEGAEGAAQIQRLGYGESQELAPLDLDLPADGTIEARLAALPSVKAAAPRIRFMGMVSNGESSTMFTGVGIELERERLVCPRGPGALDGTVARGALVERLTGPGFADHRPNGVVLGIELAKSLRLGIGQTATLLANTRSGSMDAVDVTVVGLYNFYDPFMNKHMVIVPLSTAQALLHMEHRVTAYAVGVHRVRDIDRAVGEIRQALGGFDTKTEVHSGLDLAPFYRDARLLFDAVLGVVIAIVVILVLAGVVNTMLMSVFERTREIGTLMSIGFRRRKILLLFLLESTTLGAVAGVVGGLLGTAAIAIAHRVGVPFFVPAVGAILNRPIFNGTFLLYALVGTLLATLLGGIYPARRASGLRPVEALQS